MTRMSREFSLVLLGAGMLTTGYFLWPEQDFEKRAEDQARQRAGGRGVSGGHMFLFFHGGSGAYSKAGVRSPAMAAVSSRGFGSTGARIGGGG